MNENPELEYFIPLTKSEKFVETWSMDPCMMPKPFPFYEKSIDDFIVRPDDVWSLGFPKSGTMWLNEMIWLISNNLDYEAAKVAILDRFLRFEQDIFYTPGQCQVNQLEKIEKTDSPRFIKCHLPCHFLPKQIWTVHPKIIYLARNVKDVAISMYHYHSNFMQEPLTLKDFLKRVLQNKWVFGPYHSHISDFWNMRHFENILFLTYEEMKADLLAVIEKVAKFLGKILNQNEIEKLADHLSFEKLSKNPHANNESYLKKIRETTKRTSTDPTSKHIRKGKSGSYKDEMPPEFIELFDKWTESEMKRLNCDPELRKVFYFQESL